MFLGELMNELYAFLGDDPGLPREYTRARCLKLVNEGTKEFRRRVEERWARQDIPVVQDQNLYDQPENSQRLTRCAYKDVPMEPVTVQQLQATDALWETRTRSNPTAYTTEGVRHNQFKVFPRPGEGAVENVVFAADSNVAGWSSERGIIRQWQDSGSANDTQVADPNVGGWPAERGIIRRRTNTTLSPETGIIRGFVQTEARNLTVWYVDRPAPISTDGEKIPIKHAYARAIKWYVLSRLFAEEGDRYNPGLQKYTEAQFENYVERATLTLAKPFLYEIDALGMEMRREPLGALGWPEEVMIDGSPVRVTWPRRGFWA